LPIKKFSIKERLDEVKKLGPLLSTRPPFPKNVIIEITNRCNHSCIFCANSKMTRKKARIDEKLLFSLLKQAKELGASEIGYYGSAEPFMNENLIQYVKNAKKLGFEYVYVTTNGVLATPEKSRAIIDVGLDSIKFSINAGTRESYKIIHGKDDFNKVIANLLYLAEYRKLRNRKMYLAITFIVTEQTKDECSAFKEKFDDIVDDIYFCLADNQQGYMLENKFVTQEKYFAQTQETPCFLLFNRAHISAESYLTLCCVDFQNYLAVADLSKVTLHDAWYSNTFIEMRKKHLKNDLKGTLCNNCIRNKQEPVRPLKNELATDFQFAREEGKNLKKIKSRLEKNQ
jgi:pyruvate-formate lyase-activating enzyme